MNINYNMQRNGKTGGKREEGWGTEKDANKI